MTEADLLDDDSTRVADAVSSAMRGLFGRDSLYMGLWMLQLVGAAVVTPFATRLLGLSEYGTLASANAVMQVLFVIAGCGLALAVQRWFAASGGLAAARGLVLLGILVAAAVTAIVLVSGPLWAPLLGFDGFGGALPVAVVWAGTSAVTATSLGVLRSQDRLLAFSLVSLTQSGIAEVTSLALLVLVSHTARMFLAGQLIAQIIAMALAIIFVPPRMLRRADLALVRSALRFALPLVPAMLSALILEAADRLMIHARLGEDATARYQVAYNIGSMPILVVAALDSTWLPRIFAVGNERHRQAVLAASRDGVYRLLAPVLVGFSLGSPIVLRLWAPPDFDTNRLLVVTTTVVVSALPFAAGMSARRGLLAGAATRVVALATILAATLNVALNSVLIPTMGLSGAALATLAAYSLQYVVFRAARAGDVRLAWPPPGLRYALIGAGLAFAAVFLPVDVPGLVLRVALGVVCLGWLGLAYRHIVRAGRAVSAAGSRAQPE